MSSSFSPSPNKEIVRTALRIAQQAWAQLEELYYDEDCSETYLLNEYLTLCPYVDDESELLVRIKECLRKEEESTNGQLPRSIEEDDDEKLNLHDHQVRTAVRISQRAWNQLEADSQKLSETEVLRRYVKLCPYVDLDHSAVKLVLSILAREDGEEIVKDEEDHANPSTVSRSLFLKDCKQRSQSGNICWILRFLFVDLPFLLILLTYASVRWVDHVHTNYLHPMLQDAVWTEERKDQEFTYYERHCELEDMTTLSGSELFLSDNATAQDAYEHQLLHGFTIFPKVLSEETALNLRAFVTSRNRNLSAGESIFVIENDNRYSFGLGTEEPAVARAITELANHHTLVPALERILGPSPALIEMTAITSAYGAVDQWWHDDVVPSGSAINYARSFGPSYSVFVQLQNTTKEMGATAACPGSHYCSGGDISNVCERHGFQVVQDDTGYWGIGNALLMNMNSWHRGSAHIDPNAQDRVMLILTFAPQPKERAETRMMSQGITFSLRWDMWGHTLADLKQSESYMVQPFATLRALGLFKPLSKNIAWGVDYVSGGVMRMANFDSGFRDDQFEEYLQLGGFHLLPKFLHGAVKDGDGFYEYYRDTLYNCRDLMERVVMGAVALCGIFVLFTTFVSTRGTTTSLFSGVIRYTLLAGACELLFRRAIDHVDQTGWAKDIKAHRRYAPTTHIEERFATDLHGPTSYPNYLDVLIETRYGSRELSMYNDFINGHPGNRKFTNFVEKAAINYKKYPQQLQKAAVSFVVGFVEAEFGRFLKQAPNGRWLWVQSESKTVTDFVQAELMKASSPLLKAMADELRFLKSDLKYGVFRDTVMALKHATPRLVDLQARIIGSKLKPLVPNVRLPSHAIREHTTSISLSPNIFQRSLNMRNCTTNAEAQARGRFIYPPPRDLSEPYAGAWLSQGDTAEGLFDGYFFVGTVEMVTAKGDFDMIYPDGDRNRVNRYTIRRVVPYQVGEQLEVLHDGDYLACQIVEKETANDGQETYRVLLMESGETIDRKYMIEFRRFVGEIRQPQEYESAY